MAKKNLEPESIPKASELLRWTPHKIVSLVQKEKDELYLDLPGYSPCRILDHAVTATNGSHRDVSTELKRFIKKLQHAESFNALCLLATLDEVAHYKGRTFWDDLYKESNNHDKFRSLREDNSLLVEAWPLVQHEIAWISFLSLYQTIESTISMVTLHHPLADYAKKTLFQLDNIAEAVDIGMKHRWIPTASKNRLKVSQLLLDYVASLPPMVIGVMLEDPTSEAKLQPVPQSCLPLACLQLSLTPSNEVVCQMISLYQLEQNEVYTVSTRPPSDDCSCFKCQFEKGQHGNGRTKRAWILMAQRLAHVYFQEEKYEEARSLYKECYAYFADIHKDQAKAADLWHSIAAVLLTELKFLCAQRHWKQGSRFCSLHSGIALQVEKQAAYRYFDPIVRDGNVKTLPSYYSIGTSRRLFIAPNVVSSSTCRQLIALAQEYASKKGGWTTSRHYAVPTNDIPIHQAPRLLDWFVPWFHNDVIPLLQDQFQTNQHFYVHDAFLVRYTACSSSHFLPLHYDESTHSLILALNSDFEGGGTYFYSLDHASTPSSGSLASFRGNQLLHGGNVVTKGERFILAIFLYADSDMDRKDKYDSEKDKEKFESTQPSPKRAKTANTFSFGFF